MFPEFPVDSTFEFEPSAPGSGKSPSACRRATTRHPNRMDCCASSNVCKSSCAVLSAVQRLPLRLRPATIFRWRDNVTLTFGNVSLGLLDGSECHSPFSAS